MDSAMAVININFVELFNVVVSPNSPSNTYIQHQHVRVRQQLDLTYFKFHLNAKLFTSVAVKVDLAFLGADVFGDLVLFAAFGTFVGLSFGLIVGEPLDGSKVGDSLGEVDGRFVGDSVGTRGVGTIVAVVVGVLRGE